MPSPSTIRRWLIALPAVAIAVVGCSRQSPQPTDQPVAARPVAAGHPVTIRTPSGPPSVATGAVDDKGRPVTIACATCHSTKPVNAEAKIGTPLRAFHQTVAGSHGSLSCTSCHNPADGYATLRLADGKAVPYTEVMTLCAQCHGPQYRDYQHGAHGGMTGHWDLTRGGRQRNTCTDCHHPHAPKYPTVSPAAGPNDRFLTGGGHE
ncbi:MAG: cytochrome c3 family protein [Gemmataceae bacterium]